MFPARRSANRSCPEFRAKHRRTAQALPGQDDFYLERITKGKGEYSSMSGSGEHEGAVAALIELRARRTRTSRRSLELLELIHNGLARPNVFRCPIVGRVAAWLKETGQS